MTTHTHAVLHRALRHAEEFLDGLPRRPVAATASARELRARLDVTPNERGIDAVQVLDDLVAAADGGLLGCPSGRFFAWVIGGALPSALAADWLTSAWDQNAVTHACGPAACVVEEVVGELLKQLFGLPSACSFALTTGCQLAHFAGLAAARYAVLQNAGCDVHEHGLAGSPPLRVLASDQCHGSIHRALRYLGIGRRQIIAMKTDGNGRVDVSALVGVLRESSAPTIMVLNAGDINTAAFDPFAALIPLAHDHGAWVHVDGAFGLAARFSQSKSHLLEGVEAADSWATDAHKWLNVPFDCGVAFVRHAAAHRAAMSIQADYIEVSASHRDPIDWTPEWSRRARGFALYAALRELGREGLANMIDRCCAHALAIVDGLGELPGVEVLHRPTLNQGLVRFLAPRAGATQSEHDARTDEMVASVNASGEAFFSGTTWRGRRAMRVSVVNWRTTEADVNRALAACAACLRPRSNNFSPNKNSHL
ncbi:MAG: aspartate aminotransferase family protein [Phycisphaerae bacterium]|nr:aspartate aminotransferase family protein [Phycisphaerae bacterium]